RKRAPCRASRSRFGVSPIGLPLTPSVSQRCWSVKTITTFSGRVCARVGGMALAPSFSRSRRSDSWAGCSATDAASLPGSLLQSIPTMRSSVPSALLARVPSALLPYQGSEDTDDAILRVAQSGSATGLADERDHFVVGHAELDNAGRRDHVLLQHDRPQIVGAIGETALSGALANRQPRALHVVDVIEEEAGNGQRLEIVLRRGPAGRDRRQRRVVGLVGPGDEGAVALAGPNLALRAILRVADALEVLDSLGQRLDVPEHHRGRGA